MYVSQDALIRNHGYHGLYRMSHLPLTSDQNLGLKKRYCTRRDTPKVKDGCFLLAFEGEKRYSLTMIPEMKSARLAVGEVRSANCRQNVLAKH